VSLIIIFPILAANKIRKKITHLMLNSLLQAGGFADDVYAAHAKFTYQAKTNLIF
jgi:hypothetical protein